MKKLLSLAILISGISFGASAQVKNETPRSAEKKSYVRKEYVHKDMVKLSPEQIATKRTDQLEKELKLTSKQRNEVYKLQLDQAKKFKKQQDVRTKERNIERKERLAQRQKLEKLLTPEQRSLFKNKLAKRSENGFKRGGDRKKDMERRGDARRKIERSVG